MKRADPYTKFFFVESGILLKIGIQKPNSSEKKKWNPRRGILIPLHGVIDISLKGTLKNFFIICAVIEHLFIFLSH